MNIVASAVYKITDGGLPPACCISPHTLGEVVSCGFEEVYNRVLSGPQYYSLPRLLRNETAFQHLKVTIRSAMCICSLLRRDGLITFTKTFLSIPFWSGTLNWAPAVFRIEDSLSPE